MTHHGSPPHPGVGGAAPSRRIVSRRPYRIAATTIGLLSLLGVAGWAGLPALSAVVAGSAGFDELIAATAAVAAWMLTAWVLLVAGAAAIALIPGRLGAVATYLAHRVTPAALRRVVHAAVGVAVVTAPAAVAHPGPPVHPAATAIGVDAAVSAPSGQPPADELPGVGRPPVATPALRQHREPAVTPERPAPARSPVVVESGDTLWGIAAGHLEREGPGTPTPAEIAEEWPRWFEANRDIIGADPDLIRPGTRLSPPEPN